MVVYFCDVSLVCCLFVVRCRCYAVVLCVSPELWLFVLSLVVVWCFAGVVVVVDAVEVVVYVGACVV